MKVKGSRSSAAKWRSPGQHVSQGENASSLRCDGHNHQDSPDPQVCAESLTGELQVLSLKPWAVPGDTSPCGGQALAQQRLRESHGATVVADAMQH